MSWRYSAITLALAAIGATPAAATGPLDSAHFMVMDTRVPEDGSGAGVNALLAANLERRFGACVGGPKPVLTSADVRARIGELKARDLQGIMDQSELADLASETVCKKGVLVTSIYTVVDGLPIFQIDLLALGHKRKDFGIAGATETGKGLSAAELVRKAVDALPDFCARTLRMEVTAHYDEKGTYTPPDEDNGDIRTSLSNTHHLSVETTIAQWLPDEPGTSLPGRASQVVSGETVKHVVSGSSVSSYKKVAGTLCGEDERPTPGGHTETMVATTTFSSEEGDTAGGSANIAFYPEQRTYAIAIDIAGFAYTATLSAKKNVRSCGNDQPEEPMDGAPERPTWAGSSYQSQTGFAYEPGRYPISDSSTPTKRTVGNWTVTERFEWKIEPAGPTLWDRLLKQGWL